MAKHFLYGYFGQKNTGDDAMLYCWLEKMSETDKAYILAKEPCYMIPERNTEYVPYNVFKVVLAILKADRLVLVGGTHFSNYGKVNRNLFITMRILLLCIFAKVFRKKVVFDSIGIVCGHWWLWIMLILTSIFVDKITVRDNTSKIILDTMGIKADLVPDLAVGLVNRITTLKQDDVIGVNVSPLGKIYYDLPESDIDNLKKIAARINRLNKDVKLIVFREGDTEYTKQLQRMIIRECQFIPYNPDPIIALNEITSCSVVFAMKYHACYYAKLAGITYINLSNHPKNKSIGV